MKLLVRTVLLLNITAQVDTMRHPDGCKETETGYGPLDEPNFQKIADVGLLSWLAGGRSTPESVANAIALGAQGVQVGSLFALSNESGLLDKYRQEMLVAAKKGNLRVRTGSPSFHQLASHLK